MLNHMKIAVIRLADVVATSSLGKDAEKRLQGELASIKQEIAAKRKEALKAEAESRQPSNADNADKRRDAARLKREAEHAEQEARIRVEEQRRLLLEQVLQRVQPQIDALAEQQQIDLVLLGSQPGARLLQTLARPDG